MAETERCIAKVGEPFHMRECGRPCEYLTAKQARAEGRIYSGWYHTDRATVFDEHNAVPASFL